MFPVVVSTEIPKIFPNDDDVAWPPDPGQVGSGGFPSPAIVEMIPEGNTLRITPLLVSEM